MANIREAFVRYLGDRGGVAVPKKRLPVAEAMALVRDAGGVAAWRTRLMIAHREQLSELRALGLGAVEVEYPDVRRSRILELRGWADHWAWRSPAAAIVTDPAGAASAPARSPPPSSLASPDGRRPRRARLYRCYARLS